jgi:hypothetical protein
VRTHVATPVLARRGRVEGDRLTRALLDAASAGLRPHCSDAASKHLWLSESESERAEASRLCIGCPVLGECRAAATARRERFGVWGMKDSTPRINTTEVSNV